MWWYTSVICGAILAATWFWYIFNKLNSKDFLELAEKTRWTLRPFVPVFLLPEMLRAWQKKNKVNFAFYFFINFLCATINISILMMVLMLVIMMVISLIVNYP